MFDYLCTLACVGSLCFAVLTKKPFVLLLVEVLLTYSHWFFVPSVKKCYCTQFI